MIKNFETYTKNITKNDIPKIKKLLEFFESIPLDESYFGALIVEILSDDINLDVKKVQDYVSEIRKNPEFLCKSGFIISHEKGYEVTLDDKKIEDFIIGCRQRANASLMNIEAAENYKAIRNNIQQTLDLE